MDTSEFLRTLPFIEDNFDEIFRVPESGIVYTQMEILFKILHELKKLNLRMDKVEMAYQGLIDYVERGTNAATDREAR